MIKEPNCDFCNKRGLPILPVRYAIAPVEAKAPKLAGALKMSENVPLGRFVHYSTRLVRNGFVYVFDEARKHWDGYYVTEGGHYLRFEIKRPLPSSFKSAQPCSRSGHPETAGCITISSPKQAGTIWIGFSESQWTLAVLERHQSAEYRKRHMRAFDVRAWLGSQTAQHAAKIAGVSQHVSEYSPNVVEKAYGFSAATYQSRRTSATAIVQTAERMWPGKGAIVALDDPAGVAQDLAQLMQVGVKSFASDPKYKRRLAVSTAIEQLREGIRNQAELKAIADAEQAAHRAVSPGSGFGGDGGGAANAGMALARSFNKQLDRDMSQLEERLRTLTPQQLDAAGATAWQKYSKKYDEAARAAWQASFDAKMKQFDRIFVAPLAKAHSQWMKGAPLANQFICNHDPVDTHSGLAYAAAFALCIEGTQDKRACFDTYQKWLEGKAGDERNLALRALLLNQKGLIEQAAKADVGLDPRSVPWDALIGAYDKTAESAGSAAHSVVARLTQQLGGVFMPLLDKAVDGPIRTGVVALGMAGQAPVVRVTITGGKKAFRAAVIRQLLALHGSRLDRHAMQRAVSAELRRLQMRGAPMAGNAKKTFLLLADPAAVKGMPQGLSPQQRATWLANSLRTVEQYEAAELGRWKSVVTTKVRLGVAAGLLQVFAFTKVSSDKDGAMGHEQADATARYLSSIAAMGGAFADTVGTIMVNRASQGAGSLRLSPNAARVLGERMVRWGGRANVGAAVLIAVMDVRMAVRERSEGNTGMAALYLGSAAFGVGAVIAFAFAATGVGIVLVLLFVLVTVLIELFKDNKVQDWLERTLWGRLASERYQTMDAEQRELKLALAG